MAGNAPRESRLMFNEALRFRDVFVRVRNGKSTSEGHFIRFRRIPGWRTECAPWQPGGHPLLLFNREGDCLAAKLRPGNVHSADGWEELLLPEIERQQKLGKEVVFGPTLPLPSRRSTRYWRSGA